MDWASTRSRKCPKRDPSDPESSRPHHNGWGQDATHIVEDVSPALHGDTLEHRQHGEGEVVEVGDAVLGPIPPGFAHGPVLTLSPMACLQSTRGRILFCRNISTTKETGDGRREGGVTMGRE